MEAKELRLGNYILYLNELYVVDGIKSEPHAPEHKWRIAFRTIDGKLRNAKLENWIEPIPLTPAILEKIDWAGYVKFHFNSYFSIDDVGHFFYHNDYTGINIDYLHQLQNMYFAITGKEITVNL